jgi:hypothetical protein
VLLSLNISDVLMCVYCAHVHMYINRQDICVIVCITEYLRELDFSIFFAFVCMPVYLREIDFPIIFALKSQVGPGIDHTI